MAARIAIDGIENQKLNLRHTISVVVCKFFAVLITSHLSINAIAQNTDSLIRRVKSIENLEIEGFLSPDSINLDSIPGSKFFHSKNSFDSIGNNVRSRIDSLSRSTFPGKLSSVSDSLRQELDCATKHLNASLDSLKHLNLPGDTYVKKVDSLYKNFQSNTLMRLKEKYDSLGLNVDERISKLNGLVNDKVQLVDALLAKSKLGQISLAEQVELGELDVKLPDLPASIPNISSNLSLPDVNNAATLIPNIKGVNVPGLELNNPAGLPATQFPNLAVHPNVDLPKPEVIPGISELQEIKEAATEVTTVGKQINEVKEMDRDELAQRVDQEIDKQVKRIDGVNEVAKQTESIDALKEKIESAKDLADKEKLKEQSKRKLKDYFAGKEEIVNKDLEDIGKLQIKYRNVADSRNLPKRVPNEMKDKPFVERLIPAVTFQLFASENVSVDFAPSIGYRFSGRIRAGIGAYKRITYFKDETSVSGEDIFGIRVFNNIRFVKSFYTHLEWEYYQYNLNQPSTLMNEDTNGWANRLNFGVYETYKLGKRFNGHVILLYDLLQIKEFPNTSHSALRFGLDYQIMKGKHDKKGT